MTKPRAQRQSRTPKADPKPPTPVQASAAAPTAAAPKFRDRIKELRRMKASQLLANPKNWRRHPDEQVAAMTSMLNSIGIVDALIGRDTKDGVELLDGHMRQGIAGEEIVPVLILDVDDKEASLMLATFDPLGDLAIMDAAALKALLVDVDPEDEDAFLRRMMADVNNDLAAEAETTIGKAKEIDGMALEPHEHYDFLVVFCQTSHEWNVLCDRLGLKPSQRRAKIGTGRAIRATRLLEKINAAS